MSVENFKRRIWSNYIITSLRKALVAQKVARTDFDGEVKMGGTVVFPQIRTLSDENYTAGSDITVNQLEDTASILNVNQKRNCAFEIEDVDAALSYKDLMPMGMDEQMYALRNTADSYVLGKYGDAGLSVNTNASPADIDSTNVEEQLVKVAQKMDENNVPLENRYAIIPPWFHWKLVLAGVASLSENVDVWQNGFVGRVMGFNFYVSTNVSKNSSSWDKTRMIFGIEQKSIAYAEALMKVSAVEREQRHADLIKALYVYDAKVIRPDMTCTLYANESAESS